MGIEDKVDPFWDQDWNLDGDREPTSEVRPVDGRAKRLVVDTGLRGKDAEEAWVTVTDVEGVVFFEGPPSADGCIDVSFESAPSVDKARVRLETARLHRTAEVELKDGWTAHAFAG